MYGGAGYAQFPYASLVYPLGVIVGVGGLSIILVSHGRVGILAPALANYSHELRTGNITGTLRDGRVAPRIGTDSANLSLSSGRVLSKLRSGNLTIVLQTEDEPE